MSHDQGKRKASVMVFQVSLVEPRTRTFQIQERLRRAIHRSARIASMKAIELDLPKRDAIRLLELALGSVLKHAEKLGWVV